MLDQIVLKLEWIELDWALRGSGGGESDNEKKKYV